MTEKTTVTPSIDVKLPSAFLETLLATVNTDDLTPEQLEQIKSVQTQMDEAKKIIALKAIKSELDDALMINAKVIQEKLSAIVIPESINIIKLPFSYNAETKSFVSSFNLGDIDSKFPLMTRVLRTLVSAMPDQSKAFQTKLTEMLDSAGKEAYDVDNFTNLVNDRITWLSGAFTEIEKINKLAKILMSGIDMGKIAKSETTSGSVLIVYNSAELMQKSNDDPDAVANWGITKANFGKAKTKSSGSGNGKKTKASEWIPNGYEAKSIKAYLVERFSDDEKIAALIVSGNDYNANHHLLRIEKTLENDADRAYTNFLASK